jgi:hypothetical protein
MKPAFLLVIFLICYFSEYGLRFPPTRKKGQTGGGGGVVLAVIAGLCGLGGLALAYWPESDPSCSDYTCPSGKTRKTNPSTLTYKTTDTAAVTNSTCCNSPAGTGGTNKCTGYTCTPGTIKSNASALTYNTSATTAAKNTTCCDLTPAQQVLADTQAEEEAADGKAAGEVMAREDGYLQYPVKGTNVLKWDGIKPAFWKEQNPYLPEDTVSYPNTMETPNDCFNFFDLARKNGTDTAGFQFLSTAASGDRCALFGSDVQVVPNSVKGADGYVSHIDRSGPYKPCVGSCVNGGNVVSDGGAAINSMVGSYFAKGGGWSQTGDGQWTVGFCQNGMCFRKGKTTNGKQDILCDKCCPSSNICGRRGLN